MSKAKGLQATIDPNMVFDRDGLREFLGIPDSAIRRGKTTGKLVASHVGQEDRFLGSDVLAWLVSQRVEKNHG